MACSCHNLDMMEMQLSTDIVDKAVYGRAIVHLRDRKVRLPKFSELAAPNTIPLAIGKQLVGIGPDEPNALNLFRVHWFNGANRVCKVAVPEHLILPFEITGVRSPIIVALGTPFPMIGAHKVLAAYACLVPRLIRGEFDPIVQRAVWPSTGNYCRGGIAVSRILGCRGVAVLPEGMSVERFRWLESWISNPSDIVRTPGTESNVREIYEECEILSQEPTNVILNQFCEFGNYLVHRQCTGAALSAIIDAYQRTWPEARPAAFVAASGSSGTLGAGDALKENYGTKIVAVEALECPTLLYAGFGSHNIQGIGDKHIPFIHNVMNTDLVAGVSDESTDLLNVLFNGKVGLDYLGSRRNVNPAILQRFGELGLSSLANIIGAIKISKHLGLGEQDLVVTVATDGASLYESEREKTIKENLSGALDTISAAEIFGEHLSGIRSDHVMELNSRDRERIFNLGYYTWVEQRGESVDKFQERRKMSFWNSLLENLTVWDDMIEEFNGQTGMNDRALKGD